MIDLKINKDHIEIKKLFHRDDEEFRCELLTIILTLVVINSLEIPHKAEVRMMNEFYLLDDFLMKLENAIKNKKNSNYGVIRDTIALAKEYRRRNRNENNNTKK